MWYVCCFVIGFAFGALLVIEIKLELAGYQPPEGYPRIPLDRSPYVRL